MDNRDVKKSCSFRDPAGFVFERDGEIYRQIQSVAKNDYELFVSSGLYKWLVDHSMVLRHEEGDFTPLYSQGSWKVIRHTRIPYLSYPYEWCFEQYKRAALLTLDVQIAALQHGMILKDASAYNIQFVGNRPIFIDTLSFAVYRAGQIWDGYGQYCRHFLAPLLMMAMKGTEFGRIMQLYIDGIPLDLAVNILNGKGRYKPGVFIHLYLHARQIRKMSKNNRKIRSRDVPRASLSTIVKSLRRTVASINLRSEKTEWGEYYGTMMNYSDKAFSFKYDIVKRFVEMSGGGIVCDMGANRGQFTKAALEGGANYCVSFDSDHAAVNHYYRELSSKNESRALPLLLDLTTPSPSIGWANSERYTLIDRGRFDCMLGLALVHHLTIANNIPLESIALHFAKLCKSLVIEFIPKEDSQVQKLLLNRKDIFLTYDKDNFEAAFMKCFEITERRNIPDSMRTLYFMKSKDNQ